MTEWTELLPVIDKNLAAAVSALQTRQARGDLKKEDLIQMPLHWRPEHATFSV